jgi:hypothetical protein
MDKPIHSASSIRFFKRVLRALSELGVLLLGLILSLAVASLVAMANGCYDSVECPAASATVISGILLTIAGFVLLRRRNRPWKIEYDAVGWGLARVERKLHPTRARYKRIAVRIIIWAPSVLAAFVLFFFPVATHLVYPRSQYLKHYRVPVPWTFAVLSSLGEPAEYSYVHVLATENGKGIFGFQRFWDGGGFSSRMLFGSIQPDAGTFEFNHGFMESKRAGAAMVSTREFRLGDAVFTCWQYVNRYHRRDIGPQWWDVDCGTPVAMHQNNLYGWFVGRKEDISAFYRIIEGIAPVK